MPRIEKILCPVDFSDFSIRGFEYAHSLAKHYSAKLCLEHVVEPLALDPRSLSGMDNVWRQLSDNAKMRLEELSGTHPKNGVRPELVVRFGFISQAILALAKESGADLIVMGTHGRSGLDRVVMGSVTEKVLRKANCPVLVVRKPAHDFGPSAPASAPAPLKKIIACTDFSDNAERALSYAASLAEEYGAQLTLLHVVPEISPSANLPRATAELSRRLAESLAKETFSSSVQSIVRIGRPYEEIIQLALESQADLVVMGVRGQNTLDAAIFGSTTHRVIQLGPCPVLAVHT